MSEFTPHDAIYLQVGDSDEPIGIDETTWCSDKINDGDIKYLLSTPEREAAPELYEALGDDLSGRCFEDLLLIVAKKFDDDGGGPLVDCLIDKAYKIRAALALANGEVDDE